MGKNPSESELKVMVAFLQQNRTRDLVEARALELVADMVIQHKGRLVAEYSGKQLVTLYVAGKDYDWKLTNNKFKSDIQMVSTYVWQPIHGNEESRCDWKGPICIDNMAGNSPIGDQFAARALALLNDSFTITIVNTISSYLVAEPNENRVDFNDM